MLLGWCGVQASLNAMLAAVTAMINIANALPQVCAPVLGSVFVTRIRGVR